MSESLNNYCAKFPVPGMQSEWLKNIKLRITTKDMAKICSYSERTIRDWQREKFNMDYDSIILLCKYLNITIPSVSKVYKYAHTSDAGKKGSNALLKIYGRVPVNESLRKKAWQRWWVENGSNKKIKILQPKDILVPSKSELLAEYVGIILGDGSISKYRVAVTLNAVDDLEYIEFVKRLTEKLFNVKPKVYFRKDTRVADIVVARTRLVIYLLSLGLISGHKVKHQVSIPEWIISNKKYSLACVRGLMDTDGCFFTHTYVVSGKSYSYKKITFSSASAPLRRDVFKILSNAGIKVYISGTNVRIDAIEDVLKYIKLVNSHNPKHLKRYSK